MDFVATPKTVRISDILGNKLSFSPHNYNRVLIDKTSSKPVRDFLSGPAIKGEEVGSSSYIQNSTKFFIRTKALQPDSYLLNSNSESFVPILPDKFINQSLKKGDLVISKDSNIGEVIILDRDYPDAMLSNGLYILPVEKYKYYLLALIKHDSFKTQLNFLVSRGATIKHAKTLFLDCLIPLPSKDREATIERIEKLTKQIIADEIEIRRRESRIHTLIEEEIDQNQSPKTFTYTYPSLDNLRIKGRVDAGFYSEEYKEAQFRITNYKHGAGVLKDWGYDVGRGQNLQVSAIGKSMYSNKFREDFYALARPVNLSDFGTVLRYEYLGNPNTLSLIQPGDIIFSAEGSIGKCVMFADPKQKLITNIHGIVFNKLNHDVIESAFVCCFLRYLRKKNVLDFISVGGQGGSLAMRYLPEVVIPFFGKEKQVEIASLYYNPTGDMGIIQLDKRVKDTKEEVDSIIDSIILDTSSGS